jgi:ATP synthase protein I
MLGNYARIVRRSSAVAAVVGALMVLISWAVSGPKGALGAVLGIALVAVFFTISVFAVNRAARISPQAMMAAALGTFIVKILVLMAVLLPFSTTTVFNTRLFGLTALACILAWTAAQVIWSVRLKVLYAEPSGRG